MSARILLLAVLAAALLAGGAPPALAHDDDDDARVEGSCGAGASSRLRLKADHDAIRVEFDVDSRRARERWRVTLVHERRVVWRGRARTRTGSASFRIRRSVPDFEGADVVSVRGAGPGGVVCQATATLSGR